MFLCVPFHRIDHRYIHCVLLCYLVEIWVAQVRIIGIMISQERLALPIKPVLLVALSLICSKFIYKFNLSKIFPSICLESSLLFHNNAQLVS